jgi:hypothetical protein
MRNFLSPSGWLDDQHVGDHVGRSIWARERSSSTAWVPGGRPAGLLARGLAERRFSPRTAAYAVLGLARLDPDRLEPDSHLLLGGSAGGRLWARGPETWCWFEDDLSYDNARLPGIVGGLRSDEDAVAAGPSR